MKKTILTITTSATTLANAVSIAATYIQKDGDYAGKIVISGNGGVLDIRATSNMETIHLKNISFVSSDMTVDSFDAFSIDAKRLSTVLNANRADEVSIELHDGLAYIKSARSKVKIETLAKTQNIPLPSCENKLEIGSSMIHSFNQIIHSIDSNNPKFELNGALLQIQSGIMNLVSTDTKRLSVVTSPTSTGDMEVIIPKGGIQSIIKLFQGHEISAEYDDSNLSIHTDMISYSTKLIAGKFPNWERIVPQSSEQTISIEKNVLSGLVKEASILEESIKVEINNGKIRVSGFDSNQNISTVVEDEIDSEASIIFGIAAKVILDFLASSNEESISISFNESMLPISFVSTDSHKEICMPIFLEDTAVIDKAA